MPKSITKISTVPRLEQKKRVAAYARVSSGKDAMLHSLSAQVSYYSELIQGHPGWLYCGVYSDEAKTGTKDSREGFQQLITDCRAGKLDMVITKSISRFARNTVTLLETVRELKGLGVDVFFEEQNIHTMSGDGELMMTILASYAQEESLSASENQKWRIRRGFERGELLNWRFMYGYSISKSGVAIDNDESQVVREIFNRVISGESFGSISRDLNDRNKLGPFGGKWCAQRIREVVTNEKYLGNALLQKCYRNNHLEKKELPNRGELPMYYAENTHEPIVDEDTFRRAQQAADTIHDVTLRWKPRTKSVFTGRILCTRCGRHYKRMINHGIYSWTCETYHYEGKAKCQSKRIPESVLLTEATAVLGIDDFSPDVLMNEVIRIEIPEPNHLVFVFTDGHTVERVWADRSRRDSWTDEMRAAARQKTIERNTQRCQTSQ